MTEGTYRRRVPVDPDPRRAITSWRRRGFSDAEIVLIVKRELERYIRLITPPLYLCRPADGLAYTAKLLTSGP